MAIYNSIAKTSNIVNMFSILLIVIVQGFSPCGTTNPAHSAGIVNTEVAQEKSTSTTVMSVSDLMFEYKKLQVENQAQKKELAEKDKNMINFGIECAFIGSRQTSEAVFKLVKTFEKQQQPKPNIARLKNAILKKMDSPTSKSLYVVPENLSGMQLHSSQTISTLKEIKVDYFLHWKPYADHLQKPTVSLNSEEKELIKLLSENKLSLYEFGWSMSKAWIVFCGYVHCGAMSMREYRKFDTTSTLLELIKTHNNWIMTTKDIRMLNIAAKIMKRKPIPNQILIDEQKQLAIPVSMEGGKIDENCPALIVKNRQ